MLLSLSWSNSSKVLESLVGVRLRLQCSLTVVELRYDGLWNRTFEAPIDNLNRMDTWRLIDWSD
jgi:hypothetical protein